MHSLIHCFHILYIFSSWKIDNAMQKVPKQLPQKPVKQQSHSRQVQSTEIFPNKKGTDTVPFGVIFRKIVKQTKTVLSRFAL